jgi:hypothetical protein
VPEAELRGLAAQYRKQQDAHFREIEHALAELRGLAPEVRKALMALTTELRAAVADWWRADADMSALTDRIFAAGWDDLLATA